MQARRDLKLARQVGRHLRKVRGELGLSQGSWGRHAGITRAAMSLIETGRSLPSLTTIYLLADAAGISARRLLP